MYRLWSPNARPMEVHIWPGGEVVGEARRISMVRDAEGFHIAFDPAGGAGDQYQYLVNGLLLPDPASKAQHGGVHGKSVVVDAGTYPWQDHAWARPDYRDLVIYELHLGTFTPQGTFRSAMEKLEHVRDLGATAVEIMPIGDFPGGRNWGYDGVLIYAPAEVYGSPDDFRALVDKAHGLGLAVILDCVYNHFGPDGNYLPTITPQFLNPKTITPWGPGFNFDGADSAEVRKFFVQNPVYWMENFHIDGFRLDATHAIADASDKHILSDITNEVRARKGYVIAEDERNEAVLLAPVEQGGLGFHGAWADDFHHSVRVSQTHERNGYYRFFKGTREEVAHILAHGWLRGDACDHLAPSAYVHCISNHDQVGNRLFGERLHAAIPGAAYRALSALLCLTPYTPMLFMGQEWACSTPFMFFTDHHAELGALVSAGRRREFASFPEFRHMDKAGHFPDPQGHDTFFKSKLHWAEIEETLHRQTLDLYKACLQIRKEHVALRPATRDGWKAGLVKGGPVTIRSTGMENERPVSWLLVTNLWEPWAGLLSHEPFCNLDAGFVWKLVLSSNESRFGGEVAEFNELEQTLSLKGQETLLFKSSEL